MEKKLEEAIKCMYCRQGVEWEKDPLVCLNRRIEKYKDMYAIRTLADAYRKGLFGIKVDHKRAIELYEQAIESGDPAAASNLADYYRRGVLVAQDMDRALGYSKKAAELGNPASRCNLAVREGHRGNLQAGSYHYRIAAAAGYEEALKGVKAMYMARVITKEEFTKSLRECQDAKSAMNSLQREDARKFNAGVLPSRYQEVLSTTTSSVHKKKWK